MKKERKPTWPQRDKAQREMLAAVRIFRKDGMSLEQLQKTVASMYGFHERWEEWTRPDQPAQAEMGEVA